MSAKSALKSRVLQLGKNWSSIFALTKHTLQPIAQRTSASTGNQTEAQCYLVDSEQDLHKHCADILPYKLNPFSRCRLRQTFGY